MKMQANTQNAPAVAVFGAAGHTGRFVIAELLRRGIKPIAIARSPAALTTADFPQHKVLCRTASAADMQSLDRALEGAGAVIHCAGPFLDTADQVAQAALRAGIHYLDISAEQPSTRAILDRYDIAAREAEIAVIPAMGFYGGFADLLVTAALDGCDDADAIEIMIGLDSWHPTAGTRVTGEKNTAARLVVSHGQLVPLSTPRREICWEFGDPLGRLCATEAPFSEIVLISQHVSTNELHTYLSRNALDDVRNSSTPAPQPADAAGRSAQRFVVDVTVKRGGNLRRMTASGRDIYAFSAPLICEAAVRLLDGRSHAVGAQPPGVCFDAPDFLSALTSSYPVSIGPCH